MDTIAMIIWSINKSDILVNDKNDDRTRNKCHTSEKERRVISPVTTRSLINRMKILVLVESIIKKKLEKINISIYSHLSKINRS